jgi:hypothetical protein
MATTPRKAQPRNKMRGAAAKVDTELAEKVTELFPDKETRPTPGRAVLRPLAGNKSQVGRERIKVSLGKRWSQIVTDVRDGHYTWEEFAQMLDPEELARGQLKSEAGTFVGRPPSLVPRAFFEVCQRELLRRFNDEMRANLLTATEQYLKLATTHGTMENKDRAKLLQWIIERVAGPAPKEPPKEQEDSFDVFVRGIVTVGKEDADVPDRYAGRRRKLDEIEDKEW